jgi:hypothetical protein
MADKSTTEKDDQLSQPPAADNTVAEQEITDLRSRSTAHPQDVPVVRKRRSTTRKPKAVSGPEPPVEQEERLEQSPGASYIEVPDVSNQAQAADKAIVEQDDRSNQVQIADKAGARGAS